MSSAKKYFKTEGKKGKFTRENKKREEERREEEERRREKKREEERNNKHTPKYHTCTASLSPAPPSPPSAPFRVFVQVIAS